MSRDQTAMLEAYRRVAEDATRAAGAMVLELRSRLVVQEKGPADLVTQADAAAQRLIVERLTAAFPESTFLGEEEGLRPDPTCSVRWIIDPIDGTTNYIHGFPFFAVSVGLELAGVPSVGAIYDPSHDQLYSAARGQGASRNGRPLRVSQACRLRDGLLVTGFPPGLGGPERGAELFETFLRFGLASRSVLRFGSAALSLAYLAAGQVDGLYAFSWKPWDTAAGVLLVTEAGGRVTNGMGLADGPFDLYRPDIIASNGGPLHEEIVELAGPQMRALRLGQEGGSRTAVALP